MHPRATVVTVTYASAAQMPGFLAALPPGLPLVVVDNAGGDGMPGLVRAARPDAMVLESPANVGFGAGCNQGLAHVATEFALLLNPDARFSQPALDTLLAAADTWPGASLLAPLILDEAGRPVRSWNAGQARRRRLPRDRGAESWPEGPFCSEYASGAALLLRMESGLRFDPTFFLFYEDDALCRAAGHVLVVPGARIPHEGGTSSSGGAVARLKAWHMAWSRLRFHQSEQGLAPARREAVARLGHHAGKALGHVLTGRVTRARADLAGLAGTLAWLRGRPADRRISR